eukprot:TRINITY_DN20230_c0_g1_i2.p1 TRINITY_DN20230_c0_g1~~TRINITY_DN20230_c0_g1_i2.p1  ORF type:complete len:526 (-),score=104.50 TRINITY_DN20230_c0_g1_i2:56-1633(-)
MTTDPRKSSFFKAMTLSVGVLLVLDTAATPFHRIWCCFESWVALTDQHRPKGDKMLLDISTCPFQSHSSSLSSELLLDGLTAEEEGQEVQNPGKGYTNKMARESNFPLEVLAQGLSVKIEAAKSSVEHDRNYILNAISGKELHTEPHQDHIAFDNMNATLHGIFAVAAWPQAVQKKQVQALALPAALRADLERLELHFSFFGTPEMTDSECETLASSLPPNLQDLSLDFDGTTVSDAGCTALGRAIGTLEQLACIQLNFRTSANTIGNPGVAAIVEGLMLLRNLKRVMLAASFCPHLDDDALKNIGACVMEQEYLSCLRLSFVNSKVGDQGLQYVSKGLRESRCLSDLTLNLRNCERVGDVGCSEIGSALLGLQSLTHLVLYYGGCRNIGSAGLEALAHGISGLQGLTHLDLELTSCPAQKGWHSLALGIQQLRNLTHLSLSFIDSEFFQAAEVQELTSAMVKLECLKEIELDFGACEHVTEESVKLLAKGLVKMKGLSVVVLRTDSCDVASLAELHLFLNQVDI